MNRWSFTLAMIAIVLIFTSVESIDPPKWPSVFTQQVVLTYNGNHHTTGKLFYSAKTNQERYDLQDARSNLLCASVSNGSQTACSTVITKGNLYLNYPTDRKCCRCCSEESGCVITKQNAFEQFQYIGEEDLSGQSFYKWGYLNQEFYYARKDEKFTPRRIYAPGVQTVDFLMNTYSEDSIPDSVFVLPNYCSADCPRSTICGQIEPGIENESITEKKQ